MNLELDLIEIGAILLLIALLCGASAYGGYKYESKKYDQFVSETKAVGEKQNAIVESLNQQLKDNANEANKNEITVAQESANYYRTHPTIKYVRVFDHNTGVSTVSEANSNTKIPYEANTPGLETGYFSAYSEEECESVGSQLDQLQQLLIKDGVEIK